MPNLKIVHTADFHLGAGLRDVATSAQALELERQKDYLKQLEAIERHAIESESDFVVIAGDIFDTPRPSGYLLDEFARFVQSLTSQRIKVVCVPGNHDQPRAAQTEAYMKALADVGAPNLYVFRGPDVCVLDGAKSRKSVRFIALPYLSPQMLEAAEFTRLVQSKLEELKAKETPVADYTVIVCHLYIEGARLGSEQRLTTLSDYPLPRSLFLDNDVDFVCLGHIHSRQLLNKKMAYSGSIQRVDFGEEDEEKGFIQIEEQGGDLEAHFVDLNCRPLVTLPRTREPFNLVTEADANAALVDAVRSEIIPEGAILRVRVRLGSRQLLPRNVLDDVAKEKSLLHWFLQIERIASQRTQRTQGKGLPLKEFFGNYLQSSLSMSTNREMLSFVSQEGLKIIDEVESERTR